MPLLILIVVVTLISLILALFSDSKRLEADCNIERFIKSTVIVSFRHIGLNIIDVSSIQIVHLADLCVHLCSAQIASMLMPL